jgi:hypothetical protein
VTSAERDGGPASNMQRGGEARQTGVDTTRAVARARRI